MLCSADKMNPFEVAVHQFSKVEKLMDPFSSLCFSDTVTAKQMQLVLCLGGENKVCLHCVDWKIALGLFKEVMVKEYFPKLESSQWAP